MSKFLLGPTAHGPKPKFIPIGIQVNDIKVLFLLSEYLICMFNNLHIHLFQSKYKHKTLPGGQYFVKSELETS